MIKRESAWLVGGRSTIAPLFAHPFACASVNCPPTKPSERRTGGPFWTGGSNCVAGQEQTKFSFSLILPVPISSTRPSPLMWLHLWCIIDRRNGGRTDDNHGVTGPFRQHKGGYDAATSIVCPLLRRQRHRASVARPWQAAFRRAHSAPGSGVCVEREGKQEKKFCHTCPDNVSRKHGCSYRAGTCALFEPSSCTFPCPHVHMLAATAYRHRCIMWDAAHSQI